MASFMATLIRFDMVRLLGKKTFPGAYPSNLGLLKVAGFQAPLGGWF
jgi:hypothetical protein